MKILLLSDSYSSHTQNWTNALCKNGFDIIVFSVTQGLEVVSSYVSYEDLYRSNLNIEGLSKYIPSKISYLLSLKVLRNIISKYKPDVLHAHYATSYGLLGALSGFHPLIISAWGTDVLKFPEKSILHRKILEFNFSRAERVLATSNSLAAAAKKYYDGHIEITPFGVDTSFFKPKSGENVFKNEGFIIGTVKSMEDHYGIDLLIRAFKIVKDKNPDKKLYLLLVGGGSKIEKYKKLAADLELNNEIIFTGHIEHSRIPEYHNMMNIEVFLSEYESFGVSVLEASACEKPVIVSGVGGLREVVDDNITGLIVPTQNVEETAAAIERLVRDENLRYLLGKNGRQKVLRQYSWNTSVDKMIKIYNEVALC